MQFRGIKLAKKSTIALKKTEHVNNLFSIKIYASEYDKKNLFDWTRTIK